MQNKPNQSSSFINSTNIKTLLSAGNASIGKTDKTPTLDELVS